MYTHTATHTTLLARLSAGQDSSAWTEFVDRYGDLIRRFCLLRGLQQSDADDVLQDVLVDLNRAMPNFRYDPSKGKFRSYLKTVVVHAIARKFRQPVPQASLGDMASAVVPASDDEAAEEQWEHEWRQYHLAHAMRVVRGEFAEKEMLAFERYALGGDDARRVATDLGMSTDHVYQAKSRITRRLAALIELAVTEEG
ncbi:MAG TPA: sigma-70 family RNA polymerase sigma factor [Phycisphaerales bacterium]|nr:sigma-70 family RNA polymerase sigma factor [Phycisphaerales bacterium]